MSELDLRGSPFGSGYPHDNITLWLELYYLVIVFGASRYIADVLKEEGDEDKDLSMFSVFKNFERSEASKRLILVASICRNNISTHPDPEIKKASHSTLVGELFPLATFKKSKPLSFQESCNKILHANDINFDLSSARHIRSGYLLTKVYLYGHKEARGKEIEWKATINVSKFIKAAWVCI